MQLYRFVGGAQRFALPAGVAAILLAGGVAGPVAAQARPATQTMSCAAAAALVRSKGAVVLSTSATTYDRYVSDLRYCSGGEQLKPEWVATRDTAQCFVGYVCIVPDRNNWIR